jgi:two-component system sensor histidine kinase RegB
LVELGGTWAWGIAVISAIAYALLSFRRVPLAPPLDERVDNFGQWSAVVLVMALIAYFVGRVTRSLRERERELADARERASRGEHLASLTALAAGAAHELGTPLGTIALVAKEMQRSVDSGSLLADDAQLIRQEVDRCRQILDRMRVDVIEDAAEHPTFETLAELLEDLQQDLRPDERSRLAIETSEAEDGVISRSRVLRRAVGVLIRNAFDASEPQEKVHLLFRREPERMIFQVQDSGAGMSESVRRRAGEPFFTTKPPGQGMGLGLFLVRLVAETYGGKFELQSSPGSGTRSILELPDRHADEPNHEQPRQHGHGPAAEQQRQPEPDEDLQASHDAGGR